MGYKLLQELHVLSVRGRVSIKCVARAPNDIAITALSSAHAFAVKGVISSVGADVPPGPYPTTACPHCALTPFSFVSVTAAAPLRKYFDSPSLHKV